MRVYDFIKLLLVYRNDKARKKGLRFKFEYFSSRNVNDKRERERSNIIFSLFNFKWTLVKQNVNRRKIITQEIFPN